MLPPPRPHFVNSQYDCRLKINKFDDGDEDGDYDDHDDGDADDDDDDDNHDDGAPCLRSGAICQIYMKYDHSLIGFQLENELWSHMPDLYEISLFFN